METQELDVLVMPDGTVKVEVRGVRGPRCLLLTEDLERALGGGIRERVYTGDYDVAAADADVWEERPLRRRD